MSAPTHPIQELRDARRELLAALHGRSAADLLTPGVEGAWCARDLLVHLAAGLRELARLVPDWSAWNEAQVAPHCTVRPEAAVADVVTAHARLLATLERLDDAALHRRGPTRFGFEASAWDLLLAEAAHEREYAARLLAHRRGPAARREAAGAGATRVPIRTE